MKKYLIYGMGRSGTSCLASCLSSGSLYKTCVQEPYVLSSGAYNDFDVLSEFKDKFCQETFKNNKSIKFQSEEKVYKSLDFLYSNFCGIKHVYSSCNIFLNFHLISYCVKNNINIIHQYRENLLESSLSNWLIQQTKITAHNEFTQNEIDNFNFKPIPIEKIKKLAIKSLMQIREANYILKAHEKSHYIEILKESLYCKCSKKRKLIFKEICKFLSINYKNLDEHFLSDSLFKDNAQYNKESVYKKIPNYNEFLNLKNNETIIKLTQKEHYHEYTQ